MHWLQFQTINLKINSTNVSINYLKKFKTMILKNVLTGLLFILLINPVFCQELKTPPEGKALVYIARTSSMGAAINFKYFVDEKYIGKFNGSNYLIIECEPGEHLIWASSENRDYLPSTLEANKVYVVEAVVKMGGMKARVDLVPLSKDDEKGMEKFNKLIEKKGPEELDQVKVQEEGLELKAFIDESLEKYTENTKDKEYEVLNADMNF